METSKDYAGTVAFYLNDSNMLVEQVPYYLGENPHGNEVMERARRHRRILSCPRVPGVFTERHLELCSRVVYESGVA